MVRPRAATVLRSLSIPAVFLVAAACTGSPASSPAASTQATAAPPASASPDKVRLVLNRADSSLGIRVADVEHSIGRRVDHTIVSDGRSVVYALNRGVPFFLSNREAQVSQDVLRLAQAVVGTESRSAGEPAGAKEGAQKKRPVRRRGRGAPQRPG